MLSLKWTLQTVFSLARKYAKIITEENGGDEKKIFRDIISCYFKYGFIQDQYYVNRVFEKNKEEREKLAEELKEQNQHIVKWEKQAEKERRFFAFYSQSLFDVGMLRMFRCHAYKKRYHAGEFFNVERNVEISRQHYLDGKITMGHHVLICKNSIIDYSGEVYMGDHVSISEGTVLYSHSHLNSLYNKLAGIKEKGVPVTAKTVLKSGAWVGANCIIMPGVTIGEDAVILPGSVVSKDIPDKSIASGNPAVAKELRGRRKRRNHAE